MSVAPLTVATTQDVVQLPQADLPDRSTTGPAGFAATLHTSTASSAGKLEIPELPEDLASLTTRELRTLSNQLYRVLDTDFPPFGVQEDYEAVADVLVERETRAAEQSETRQQREKFRDNAAGRRFELFNDGAMVGYVKYDIRSGRIRLLETVVAPSYERAGLEAVLVRETLLNIHRRRLRPIPYCRHAQAFLAENPQFRALIPVG